MARMFLVSRHTKALRNPKSPFRGENAFMDNEAVVITKNLKNKDYSEASVILDVAEQKVIKNRFTERPFDELWTYFLKHYGDYINQWLTSQRPR
jgi:hypothetical protein